MLFWYVFALGVPCRTLQLCSLAPCWRRQVFQKETVALICSLEEPVSLHFLQRKPLDMSLLTLPLQNTLKNVACHCPSDLTSFFIILIYFSIFFSLSSVYHQFWHLPYYLPPILFVIATAESPVLPQPFHLHPHLFSLRNFLILLSLTLLQESPYFWTHSPMRHFPQNCCFLSTSFFQFFNVSRNWLPCLSFKPLFDHLQFFFYCLPRLPMLRSHKHIHCLEIFESSYAYLHQLYVFNCCVCQTSSKQHPSPKVDKEGGFSLKFQPSAPVDFGLVCFFCFPL